MLKLAQKMIAAILSICMLIAICPIHAFATDLEQAEPAPASENTAPIITLYNYDGTVVLATIESTVGAVLTQDDLIAEIELMDAIRGGYKFVGWSTTAGEVDANYVPVASFTVEGSMSLYAVHRLLVASDVNGTVGSEFLTSIETFDALASEFGFSADELANETARSDEFYAYIDDFVDAVLAEETTETYAIAEASNTSSTISALRFEHALADAVWSKNQRSELPLAKEVVYMFTSHYVDVAEPLSGTVVDHDDSMFQQYITDLDRRTYETYYLNSSHLDLYNSMLKFVSALCDVPGVVSNAFYAVDSRNSKLSRLKSLIDAIGDGTEVWKDTVRQEINDAYLEISLMEDDIDDLHTQLDELAGSIYNNLSANYSDVSEKAGDYIVSAALLLTGSTVTLAAVFDIVGFYANFFETLMDRAYYVAMRAYIQTRIGERMMYAWGMSDGRN